jgi:capsular polysaccharide biosynthesis protein
LGEFDFMMTVKVHTYTEEDNTFLSKIKCLKEDKAGLDISINKCVQNRAEERLYQKYVPQDYIDCVVYNDSYLVTGIKQKNSCTDYVVFDENKKSHDETLLAHDSSIPKLQRKNVPLDGLNYKINENCKKYLKVCPILSAAGDSWAHFMWENAGNLFWISDFLRENEDVALLLFKPVFDSFDYIIRDVLALKNDIIYIRKNETVFAKEIYSVRNHPFDQHKFTPPAIVRNTRSKLYNHVTDDPKNFVFIPRRDQSKRKVKNVDEIVVFLKSFCELNGLIFIEFNAENFSYRERFKIFSEAKYVLAPHGGANIHCYWFNEKCKFIEVCFPADNGFHEFVTTCCAFGLDAYCISVDGNHYQNSFNLNIDKVKKILNGQEIVHIDTESYYWNLEAKERFVI